jgi:predicted chitinase
MAGPAASGATAASVVGHFGLDGASASAAPPASTTYVVKSGDTLSGIASQLGSTPDAIAEANGLKNPNDLSVGQHLTIPVGAAQQGATKPAPGAATGTSTASKPATGAATGTATAAATGASTANAAQLPGDTKYNGNALATVSEAVIKVVPASYRQYAQSHAPVILQQCAARGIKDSNQVAYVLATTDHESKFGKPNYSRSESLVEDHNPFTESKNGTWSATVHTNGAHVTGNSEAQLEQNYWDSAYGGRLGNKKGTTDGENFRGRGFVQLTGRSNYANMSAILNQQGFSYTYQNVTYGGQGNPPIDLTAHPDHVNLVPELAARIMVTGMQRGSFTGKSLDNYINSKETDFTHARAIINGDTATNGATIAATAKTFQGALTGWPSVFVLEQPAAAAPATASK